MFNIDPKDAKQMMSRPPQRVSIISAILFFVVAMFIGSQMMTMMNGAETDTLITSEFVQAVEQDRVQNVVYDAGSYTVTGTYYPAATAGSTASDAYNNAIGALNAQVQGVLGTDAPTVDTTNLDAKSVGTPRKYTSTYVGQDSLMQLLKSHPDVEYQVKLPDGMGDFLMSLLPTLLLRPNEQGEQFANVVWQGEGEGIHPRAPRCTFRRRRWRRRGGRGASGNQRLPRQP